MDNSMHDLKGRGCRYMNVICRQKVKSLICYLCASLSYSINTSNRGSRDFIPTVFLTEWSTQKWPRWALVRDIVCAGEEDKKPQGHSAVKCQNFHPYSDGMPGRWTKPCSTSGTCPSFCSAPLAQPWHASFLCHCSSQGSRGKQEGGLSMTFPSWSFQDDVCAIRTSKSPKENKPGIIIAALCKVAVGKGTGLSLQDGFSLQQSRCHLAHAVVCCLECCTQV